MVAIQKLLAGFIARHQVANTLRSNYMGGVGSRYHSPIALSCDGHVTVFHAFLCQNMRFNRYLENENPHLMGV